MRDRIVLNTTIAQFGNSFCIPISKKEVELIGASIGDDLEVTVTVMERKKNE